MAERRESRATRTAKAREEARLRAAAFQQEETELQKLAVDHIVLLGDADLVEENAEKAIEKIQQQKALDLAPIEAKANEIVARIVELRGPTQAAARLGLTAAAVRAAVKAAKQAPTDADLKATEPPAIEAHASAGAEIEQPGSQNSVAVPEQTASPENESTHGPGALTV